MIIPIFTETFVEKLPGEDEPILFKLTQELYLKYLLLNLIGTANKSTKLFATDLIP